MNDALGILEGQYVRLLPMTMDHLDALCACGFDPAIWTWLVPITTREQMAAWMRTGMQWREEGTAVPFVIENKATGKLVGGTRFANYEKQDARAEIGWTWLVPSAQRTPINTEAKYLLLVAGFETLKLNRVEWRTDVLNSKSRAAIQRLGAKFEGIFRKHRVMPDGRVRDTIYFSMINDEWPEAKQRLESMLNRN